MVWVPETNKLNCRIHYQKDSTKDKGEGGRLDGLHAILQRRVGNQDCRKPRNPVLRGSNDLGRVGAGNGQPQQRKGTKILFTLGAPDSRTKG